MLLRLGDVCVGEGEKGEREMDGRIEAERWTSRGNERERLRNRVRESEMDR